MYHLAEPVNEHKNTIILVRVCGKYKDKVRGYGFPALGRDGQRLQRGFKGRTRFHLLPDLTDPNVPAHELILAGPVKVAAHCEVCFLTTTMSTNRCVVVLIHDTQSQITMILVRRQEVFRRQQLSIVVSRCELYIYP